MAVVLLVLHWRFSRGAAWRRAARNHQFRLVMLYLGWGVVTIPLALGPGGAAKVAQRLPVAIVLVLSLLLCEPTPRALGLVTRWMVVLLGLYAAMIFSRGAMVAGRLTSRGMYDPNDLATVLAAMCPIAIMIAVRNKGVFRWASAAAAAVFLLAIAFTASRGGLLALLVGTIVLVLGLPLRRKVFFTGLVCAAAYGCGVPGLRSSGSVPHPSHCQKRL